MQSVDMREEIKRATFGEKGINATFLDFETTGLNFRTDSVIEVAVAKVRDGEVFTFFNSLVRFDGVLNPKIESITGHTTEEVNRAPLDEAAILEIIDQMLGENPVVVAYNGLFDLSFLDSMYRRNWKEAYARRYNKDDQLDINLIDPLSIARDRYPYPHKLGNMCERLGIPLENAHSAIDDMLALIDLTNKLHELEPIDGYFNFVRYLSRYEEPEWCPSHIRLESDRNRKNPSTQPGVTKNRFEARKAENRKRAIIVTNNKTKKRPANELSPETKETIKQASRILPPKVIQVNKALRSVLKEFAQKTKDGEVPESLSIHDDEKPAVLKYLVEVERMAPYKLVWVREEGNMYRLRYNPDGELSETLRDICRRLLMGDQSVMTSTGYPGMSVYIEDFEGVWYYLTVEKNVPERYLDSEMDTPEEACIYYTGPKDPEGNPFPKASDIPESPFTEYGDYVININDDDLPF